MQSLRANVLACTVLSFAVCSEAAVVNFTAVPISSATSITLDLDSNGVVDIILTPGPHSTNTSNTVSMGSASIPLTTGATIGTGGFFGQATLNGAMRIMAGPPGSYATFQTVGPYSGNSPSYMGVRFQRDSNTHYGWLYLTPGFSSGGPLVGGLIEIYAGAWNNTPDQAILAGQEAAVPEPAVTGLTALGVALVWMRRRCLPS